ncbi:MAG: sigma-70 family RNA polymerase sigma factor [Gammaproteobacteria bacterium]|nr:sigma-70 family RNA polymerase sigma factor [Gammaproteobacteria bacterium]NNJ90778.1 sigma-70 family RNA polymerase sigma factor [Gammaproteobacteria bacterium]
MTTVAFDRFIVKHNTTKPTRDQLFQSLVTQYADDVFRYAYWLCGNKPVAEDLAQETFLRAWKSIDKLNDAKAVKGWLFTIVRRENARRFERKQFDYSDFPSEEIPENKTHYDTSTEAHALREALKRLPVEYREPLLLQVEFGYSQKEIANYLGISVGGAGTRLFRARQQLKEMLE